MEKYIISKITSHDIRTVYDLFYNNPLYFTSLNEKLTYQKIESDLVNLPPGALIENKYYLGFWDKDYLVAVLELILSYPEKKTVLIGFFMVNNMYQGKNIGSEIIENTMEKLKKDNYKTVVLSYVEGNEQSKHFWIKNHFIETDEIEDFGDIRLITMERKLY